MANIHLQHIPFNKRINEFVCCLISWEYLNNSPFDKQTGFNLSCQLALKRHFVCMPIECGLAPTPPLTHRPTTHYTPGSMCDKCRRSVKLLAIRFLICALRTAICANKCKESKVVVAVVVVVALVFFSVCDADKLN